MPKQNAGSMLAGNVLDKFCQNSKIVGSALTDKTFPRKSLPEFKKTDSTLARDFFIVQKLLNNFRNKLSSENAATIGMHILAMLVCICVHTHAYF